MALDHQEDAFLKLQKRNSSDSIEDVDLRYTSLKDIMLRCPPKSPDGSDAFDYSSIVIRNQLVKCAALAYLQSATILAGQNENRNIFTKLWSTLKKVVVLRVSSKIAVANPVRSCLPIDELLAGMKAERLQITH